MSEEKICAIAVGGHTKRLQNNLKEFFNEEKFCDVELVSDIDEKKVPAHITILAAMSDYFKCLIAVKLNDSANQQPLQLHLYVSGHVLRILLNYFYTGSIELCESTMTDVFAAAHLFQLNEVVNVCQQFIMEHVSSENCLDLYCYAKNKQFDGLLQHILNYIQNNFAIIFQKNCFLKLEFDYFVNIVEHIEPEATNREDVFMSVQRWVEHEKETREKYIDELVDAAKLPLLSSAFLLEVVEPFCSTLKSSKACLNAVSLNSRKSQQTNVAAPISNDEILLVTDCEKPDSGFMNMAVYCSKKNEWLRLESTVPFRSYHSFIMFNSKLFFVGGKMDGKCIDTVISMDLKTLKWKYEEPLMQRRTVNSAVVIKNDLYVVGGCDEHGKKLNKIECLDSINNKWSMIHAETELNIESGTAYENKLYTLNYNKDGTTIKCYDPQNVSWTTIAIIEGTRHWSCRILNGIAHLFGGGVHNEYDLAKKTVTKNNFDDKICTVFLWENAMYRNDIIASRLSDKKTLVKYNTTSKLWTVLPTCHVIKDIYGITTLSRNELDLKNAKTVSE